MMIEQNSGIKDKLFLYIYVFLSHRETSLHNILLQNYVLRSGKYLFCSFSISITYLWSSYVLKSGKREVSNKYRKFVLIPHEHATELANDNKMSRKFLLLPKRLERIFM